MKEGQDLYSLIAGRPYNAELRAEMSKFGLRRLNGSEWISKATANKFELVFTEDGDSKIVTNIYVYQNGIRVPVVDNNQPSEPQPQPEEESTVEVSLSLHHKTQVAIDHQLDIAYNYLDLIEQWNYEMHTESPFGKQLSTALKREMISWKDFVILPDPTATGEYLFFTLRDSKTAAFHSWLDLPNGQYVVPTEGTTDAAFDSLMSGIEFHQWESASFETAAAAGQFAIKALNASQSSYAQIIHKLLGKEGIAITRNDFYRNPDGIMCRIEIGRDERGLVFTDVPVEPSVSECIDCLLAPYIKARAREAYRQEMQEMGYW